VRGRTSQRRNYPVRGQSRCSLEAAQKRGFRNRHRSRCVLDWGIGVATLDRLAHSKSRAAGRIGAGFWPGEALSQPRAAAAKRLRPHGGPPQSDHSRWRPSAIPGGAPPVQRSPKAHRGVRRRARTLAAHVAEMPLRSPIVAHAPVALDAVRALVGDVAPRPSVGVLYLATEREKRGR
jgi:hypothetical protein